MCDREKVLKGLECLITNETPCDGCQYAENGYCLHRIAVDAKEQIIALDGALQQCRWERDTAVDQLKKIGKSLGEKMDDVVELLKEQEPRVMAMEEVKHAEAGSVAWIEWRREGKINSAILFRLINKGIDDSLEFHVLDGFVGARLACYGTEWRCWTSRPTDEQREAVKWDE